jgi:hypothetical protein
MTNEEIERGLIWNSLCNMGNVVKLRFNFDSVKTLEQLKEFEDNWCPYNVKKDVVNNRWGLPLTSHSGDILDNYHLNSFGYMQKYHNVEMKEDNFNTPTSAYHALTELSPIIDKFRPNIGRVHLLRLDQGGFFPPHRDFVDPAPEYVRLLAVFGKCRSENYVQLVDGKAIYPDPGFLYFINFQLDHSVFSFSDGLHSLILTVKLNKDTYNIIRNNTTAE